jgi:hypothetical protein
MDTQTYICDDGENCVVLCSACVNARTASHPNDDERRPVRGFVQLDRCRLDADQRGDCVTFDVHGLWWSVPVELSIRQIDAEMRELLDTFGGIEIGPWRPSPQLGKVTR